MLNITIKCHTSHPWIHQITKKNYTRDCLAIRCFSHLQCVQGGLTIHLDFHARLWNAIFLRYISFDILGTCIVIGLLLDPTSSTMGHSMVGEGWGWVWVEDQKEEKEEGSGHKAEYDMVTSVDPTYTPCPHQPCKQMKRRNTIQFGKKFENIKSLFSSTHVNISPVVYSMASFRLLVF